MTRLFIMLMIVSTLSYAENTAQLTQPVAFQSKTTPTINESPVILSPSVKPSSSMPLVSSPNVSNVDKVSQEILSTNRQIELAKKRNELRKLENGGDAPHSSGGAIISSSNSQTTVLGVSINGAGKRFATLQFADGGTLDVEIGSIVGKYKVSDIELTKVVLSSSAGKGKTTVTLKRFYDNSAKPVTQQAANNQSQFANPYFTPTQITTNANTGANGADAQVPPIVSVR